MNDTLTPMNSHRDSAREDIREASSREGNSREGSSRENGIGRDGIGRDGIGRDAVREPMEDVFPEFTISLEEAGRRVKLLKEFVREHMTEGEDYGIIPGASPKPTLFKAGAEKLNAIFGLAPVVEVSNRVEDWDKGFVTYEVKVTLLNKRTTNVEAEGVGSCNSRERRYKNQDAANIANTILKMAKKRALIDATLSATRASGLFTQDLEDMDRDDIATERSSGPTYASPFVPARQAREARAEEGETQQSNLLTEAQRGAILAIANKVFGRNSREEMSKLTDKPLAQLTKGEASALIDRLRALLPEQPQASDREKPRAFAIDRNGRTLK